MKTRVLVFGAVGCLAMAVGPRPAAAEDAAAGPTTIQNLFDGRTLGQWKKTAFGGEGDVEVSDGRIVIDAGNPLSGIHWTGQHPRMNYELTLEAMRVSGSDFFCGLTFPVGNDSCSFICGGWGGGVVGLSSLDGSDASENETTKYQEFESGRWYKIRLRVTDGKIGAWIDNMQMVDVDTADKRISVRIEVDLSRPLGVATYNTAAALRNVKLTRLPEQQAK
jgi:hypothetical protein